LRQVGRLPRITEQQEEVNTDINELFLKNAVHVRYGTLLTLSRQTTTLKPFRETEQQSRGSSHYVPVSTTTY